MSRDEILLFLHRFKQDYHTKYNFTKIGIFGSAAKDTMSEGSDIDIVVDLKRPNMFDLVGIKQALEEQLHRPVDIVRYRVNMNKFLKKKIDSEAIYV